MALIELKNTTNQILTSFNNLVTGILETLNPNGTVKKIFGDWETKLFNTKYQAPTDGIVHTWSHTAGLGHDTRLIGVTSPDNNIYLARCASTAIGSDTIADTYDGFSMAVKKGEWWEVEKLVIGGPDIAFLFWRPIGE